MVLSFRVVTSANFQSLHRFFIITTREPKRCFNNPRSGLTFTQVYIMPLWLWSKPLHTLALVSSRTLIAVSWEIRTPQNAG